MFLTGVAIVFGFVAFHGFPWKLLTFAVPLAALGGMIDSPPDFERLNAFAADTMTALTKALIVTTSIYAICRLAGGIAHSVGIRKG